MRCQKCSGSRIAIVSAKCSDCFGMKIGNVTYDGYVPNDIGIGGDDYVNFAYCFDCGQIQGKFPIANSAIMKETTEKETTDEQVIDFFENHFNTDTLIEYRRGRQKEYITQAEYVSYEFSEFVKEFFRYNASRDMLNRYPMAQVFLQMFRNDKPSLKDW